MESSEYKILRERLGSQDKASKILDVCVATIHKRERGGPKGLRITREAELALRWAVQEELVFPTPHLTHVAKKSPRRRK